MELLYRAGVDTEYTISNIIKIKTFLCNQNRSSLSWLTRNK